MSGLHNPRLYADNLGCFHSLCVDAKIINSFIFQLVRRYMPWSTFCTTGRTTVSMTPDWKRKHGSSGFPDFPVLTRIANAEKGEITMHIANTTTMRVVCGAGHCLPHHLHISLSKQCSLKVTCRCSWNIMHISRQFQRIAD